MKFGIVYRATAPNKKVYIGITVCPFGQRIRVHRYESRHKYSRCFNSKLSRAIRKYGDDIKWEIIHHHIAENILRHLEAYEVSTHDSYKNGYNSTYNGKGISDKKLHSKKRKKAHSKRMIGANNPFFGKRHDPIKALKWNSYRIGQKDSIYTRVKKSIARKGDKNPMFGKKRSEDIKQGLREIKTKNYNIVNTLTGEQYPVRGIKGVYDFAKHHWNRKGVGFYQTKKFYCFKLELA